MFIFFDISTINLRILRFYNIGEIIRNRKGERQMKSTCRRTIIGVAVAIVSGIAFSGVFAEQTSATASSDKSAVQKKGQGDGQIKSLFEAYQSKMKSFMEQKQKERQDFMGSLKDKTPADQKTAIDQFRTKQTGEIKSFVTQQRS
jgi:hypothetical protein